MATYDVWILEFVEEEPAKVVAGLVATLGLGEGSAAALAGSVRTSPRAVKRGLTKGAAEQMAMALQAFGARVAIEADDPDDDAIKRPPPATAAPPSPLAAMRRIRVGTGADGPGQLKSAQPATSSTAETQEMNAAPPRVAPPPAPPPTRAPQVTLAAESSQPAIDLPPLLDAAALAAPLDIPGGSISPQGPAFQRPIPRASAVEPLPEFSDPSFGGLPTLEAPANSGPPAASPSMVTLATGGHDELDDAFSDPLDHPGMELELEDVPELHRSLPPRGAVVLDSQSEQKRFASSNPASQRPPERPSHRSTDPAPVPFWQSYKAELLYATVGITLLLFGIAREASIFQGQAGLFGVLLDSQAITLIVMATWSAVRRRGESSSDADGIRRADGGSA